MCSCYCCVPFDIVRDIFCECLFDFCFCIVCVVHAPNLVLGPVIVIVFGLVFALIIVLCA